MIHESSLDCIVKKLKLSGYLLPSVEIVVFIAGRFRFFLSLFSLLRMLNGKHRWIRLTLSPFERYADLWWSIRRAVTSNDDTRRMEGVKV